MVLTKKCFGEVAIKDNWTHPLAGNTNQIPGFFPMESIHLIDQIMVENQWSL